MNTSFTTAVEAVIAQLDATNTAREASLVISRTLIRQCANTIRAIHRREWPEAEQLLRGAAATAAELRGPLNTYPAIFHAGYSQDAFKEYAEAHLTFALVRNIPLPTAAEIQVEPAAYLNGLGEAVGELRRHLLDGLRRGPAGEREEALLAIMDEIYGWLVTIDFPDAVTAGLRRTTDVVRGILEKTRGDLTLSLRQQALESTLREFESRLGAR